MTPKQYATPLKLKKVWRGRGRGRGGGGGGGGAKSGVWARIAKASNNLPGYAELLYV